MKVSEFFGKRVLSTSGKTGYVVSVNVSGGKICCLVCADGDEREFFVDPQNILSCREEIIFRERENHPAGGAPLRLGVACFDMRGKYLGRLADFTLSGDRLKQAKIGKKNYPAEGLILGDAVIVKDMRRVNSDVKKDGRVLFKKGTYVTDQVLDEAALSGEYVQTTLKSL